MRLATVLVSLSTLSLAAFGQRLDYFNPPIVEKEIFSDPGVLIGDGNAVVISPFSGTVVATHSDGSVFSIKNGAKFIPESLGGSIITCKSGVEFYQLLGTEYIVYAIIDGAEAR